MRVGILFGGQSREREISFAGGRTVFDNLDKSLFEPVPIFIDSCGRFILLNWQNLYKGSIRDFYPPVSLWPENNPGFMYYVENLKAIDTERFDSEISSIGTQIKIESLPEIIDLAFLALHGSYGEDGRIQGILEWMGIPYTGSGILGSAIGINKTIQKRFLHSGGFSSPDYLEVTLSFPIQDFDSITETLLSTFSFPFVVKPPLQGSSIGVSVCRNRKDIPTALLGAVFCTGITKDEWRLHQQDAEKVQFISKITDIRHGIGLPLHFPSNSEYGVVKDPADLIEVLDTHFETNEILWMQALDGGNKVLVESFIHGIEFSVIVIRDTEGKTVALPPTEIVKGEEVFDYHNKYLPGFARKITPIRLPETEINRIRNQAENLVEHLGFEVYARLDGFYSEQKEIFFNDPNTTSGMLPSSFFFHQAAEIGLNPSKFLTYIILTSLSASMGKGWQDQKLSALNHALNESILSGKKSGTKKTKVGIILGGYSTERHISVESGRNIYEKLSSSSTYYPEALFLLHNKFLSLEQAERFKFSKDSFFSLWKLPVSVLLKDHADDIRDKIIYYINGGNRSTLTEQISEETKAITDLLNAESALLIPQVVYLSDFKNTYDFAFIGLHGRPGEDGELQTLLETEKIPYNGSGIHSSKITIDKFQTNSLLRSQGIPVAAHLLIHKSEYLSDPKLVFQTVEATLGLPMILKPSDDGCSSAVIKIRSKEVFHAYCRLSFRESEEINLADAQIMGLRQGEEFPSRQIILAESLIQREEGEFMIEVTVGLYTERLTDGTLNYHILEPSETLAADGILSLEEKFLAGEGQNITPARFHEDRNKSQEYAHEVKEKIKKVAQHLNIEGYSRIDAFVKIKNNQVEVWIIEANSLPGMTPATCIFHQAAIDGLTPFDFIHTIITQGMHRYQLIP